MNFIHQEKYLAITFTFTFLPAEDLGCPLLHLSDTTSIFELQTSRVQTPVNEKPIVAMSENSITSCWFTGFFNLNNNKMGDTFHGALVAQVLGH